MTTPGLKKKSPEQNRYLEMRHKIEKNQPPEIQVTESLPITQLYLTFMTYSARNNPFSNPPNA